MAQVSTLGTGFRVQGLRLGSVGEFAKLMSRFCKILGAMLSAVPYSAQILGLGLL